jgi:hypothetical protein
MRILFDRRGAERRAKSEALKLEPKGNPLTSTSPIGDWIDAALIFAWANFISVHLIDA